MSVNGVEVDPRRGRHPGFTQQSLAKAQAVVGQMADIGIDIKCPVGWGDAGQAHDGQRVEQQLPVAAIAGDMALQFVRTVESGQSGALRQHGRSEEQIAHPRARRVDQFRRHDHPAQPPSGHAVIFGKAVHDDGVGRILQHRMGRFAKAEAMVDFIGDDANAPVGADGGDPRQFSGRNDRAGRVGGTGEDQAIGCRGEHGERVGTNLIAFGRAAGDFDRVQIERLQRIAIGDIARPCGRHPRARREQAGERQHQRRGCATRQDDLFGIDGDGVAILIIAGHALFEGSAFPIAHGFGVEHMMCDRDRPRRRAGRWLAELHMQDRAALFFQRMRFPADGDGVEGGYVGDFIHG